MGRVDGFSVPIESAEAKFFAALPYEVGDIAVTVSDVHSGSVANVSVKVDVPADAKDCHPVLVEIYDPNGVRNRLYSGVCDAKGGVGYHAFRTALNDIPGRWRVIVTDYVTGKKALAAFSVK
jgi:hypothetical protein